MFVYVYVVGSGIRRLFVIKSQFFVVDHILVRKF